MLHFILFFNGKAEGQIIIFFLISHLSSTLKQVRLHSKCFMDIKDGSIFKWNNTLNRISYRNIVLEDWGYI